MRSFKFILKILLVLICICSVVLNIILFGSSYGSLLFKYDKEKFSALYETSSYYIENYLDTQREKSIQFDITTNDSKYTYLFNVDKAGAIFMSSTSSTNGNEVKEYYANYTLYTDNGSEKFYESISESNFKSYYYNVIYSLLNFNGLNVGIIDNKSKTKPIFSFKPAYILGIGYTCENGTTSSTYKFDLKGLLREARIDYNDNSKDTKIIINYSSKTIEFPDNISDFNQK